MKLKNSIIFITGAAKRVGKSIALELASQGAHLIIHYNRSQKEAQQLKNKIEKKYSQKVALVQGDLSQYSHLKRVSGEAWQAFGKIHVLINNASTFYPTPLGKTKETEWDDLFNVNTKAPYFLSESLGLKMKQQGKGKIINIADWAALKPYAGYLPYCASKAALIAINKGLAKALAPQVQVNAILPGPILWPEKDKGENQKAILKKTPLGRMGSPLDIAAAIRFFIEGSDFATGSELHVDGGRHID